MVLLTVMYPVQPDSRFDMDYYLNTHLPFVCERWGPMGMRSPQIAKGLSSGDLKSPPTHQVMGMAQFESLDVLRDALAAHGEEIFRDVPNYTDVHPVVQVSEVIA